MGTWVLGKGQGYVRTKEINVSHIISVCLVVIARKRENILSRQKLLQVAFSRQDAIVQQQKSSADVKTAINVTNMTLVFLFGDVDDGDGKGNWMMGNHLFGLAGEVCALHLI